MTHCITAKCERRPVCVHVCARLTSHAERYDVIILDWASWRVQISCPVVQELRLPSLVCYFPQILHGETSSSVACY